MTNLLPVESQSDFFIMLYRELSRIQVIVETYVTDYFIRQRFDMVAQRDLQRERDVRLGIVGRQGQLTGFAAFPTLTYWRKIDHQQRISSSIMSHLNFITFQFLDLDEAVYTKRLNDEMVMWIHKKELCRSPHRFIRMEAAKMTSAFIQEQEDLIKFKKDQRYSRDDKEITKKDLSTYLRRL